MQTLCTVSMLCLACWTMPAKAAARVLPPGPATDYAFETSEFLAQTEYADPDHKYLDLSPAGGYGTNKAWDETHQGQWFIEEQKWGADLVMSGVNRHNQAAIARGLHMLGWGFAHENADGSFACPDAYHSTSFFVEAVAHSILILEQSPFAGQYRATTEPWKAHLLAAARWMAKDENVAASLRGPLSSLPYTHRRYLVAAALGETGALLHDASLLAAAERSAKAGLAMQDPSGFNPEKGGWDSSYHAVGVMYALRYEAYAAPAELRPQLDNMLLKAIDWAESRIRPAGTMNLEGNTRIGPQDAEINRERQRKLPNYRMTFRILYYQSMLSGDDHYAATAAKVARNWPELPASARTNLG